MTSHQEQLTPAAPVEPDVRSREPRRALTFDTMGTTVSFRGPDLPGGLLSGITDLFQAADQRFSTYRSGSEIARINQGDLALPRASKIMKDMYELALAWRTRTNGHFTPHTPEGLLDLNGVVKAHTMAAADALLTTEGVTDWCLSVGGDIIGNGRQPDGHPWTIGITDPADPTGLLSQTVITPTMRAVATSGTLERGNHLWDGTHHSHTVRIVQATIVAPDIITADVLATTLAAAGPSIIEDLLRAFPIEYIAADDDSQYYASDAFRTHT